jgi:hypothetical protein
MCIMFMPTQTACISISVAQADSNTCTLTLPDLCAWEHRTPSMAAQDKKEGLAWAMRQKLPRQRCN